MEPIDLIKVCVWPFMVFVLAIVFLFIFRKPITALIGRTKEVSKSGFKAFSGQTETTEKPPAVEELSRENRCHTSI